MTELQPIKMTSVYHKYRPQYSEVYCSELIDLDQSFFFFLGNLTHDVD